MMTRKLPTQAQQEDAAHVVARSRGRRCLTDEERDDLAATWMHDDFDAIVERIQARVRVARTAEVP